MLTAVAVGSLLLTPPALAKLPAGYSSPQGSKSFGVEARLDGLIEQRTGKAEPLPELGSGTGPLSVETTYDSARVPLSSGLSKTELKRAPVVEAPVLPAAPMAPAVAEPPRAAVAPAAGLQARTTTAATAPSTATSAAAAAPASGGSNGLVIGGGVLALGAVAAAVLSGSGSSSSGSADSTTTAMPAAATPDAGSAPASDAKAPVESSSAQ